MTDQSFIRDGLPSPYAGLQQTAHFNVDGVFHPAILVKDSLKSKEHFTSAVGHPRKVLENQDSIEKVVAQNLAYWMREADNISQSALAEKAGVSQKTVSNYLNPEQRAEGASGKAGSPKLFELDRIARALGISTWQLVRQMSESERAMYAAIEAAYQGLIFSASPQKPRDQGVSVTPTAPELPALSVSEGKSGRNIPTDELPKGAFIRLASTTEPAKPSSTPILDREDRNLGKRSGTRTKGNKALQIPRRRDAGTSK